MTREYVRYGVFDMLLRETRLKGGEKIVKETYGEMMDPKMCIYFSSYGEDVEDIDVLIYF